MPRLTCPKFKGYKRLFFKDLVIPGDILVRVVGPFNSPGWVASINPDAVCAFWNHGRPAGKCCSRSFRFYRRIGPAPAVRLPLNAHYSTPLPLP